MTESIVSLLSSISPVVGTIKEDWDALTFADISPESLQEVLNFFYSGRYINVYINICYFIL